MQSAAAVKTVGVKEGDRHRRGEEEVAGEEEDDDADLLQRRVAHVSAELCYSTGVRQLKTQTQTQTRNTFQRERRTHTPLLTQTQTHEDPPRIARIMGLGGGHGGDRGAVMVLVEEGQRMQPYVARRVLLRVFFPWWQVCECVCVYEYTCEHVCIPWNPS